MTLEEYFRKQTIVYNGTTFPVIDHTLRCELLPDGGVTFYLHPANTHGDTVDFQVNGNVLIPNPRVTFA